MACRNVGKASQNNYNQLNRVNREEIRIRYHFQFDHAVQQDQAELKPLGQSGVLSVGSPDTCTRWSDDGSLGTFAIAILGVHLFMGFPVRQAWFS